MHKESPRPRSGNSVRVLKGVWVNTRCSPLRTGGLGEICAWGFRNPFRCGFDRLTDELYCGDVGNTDVESVDIIE